MRIIKIFIVFAVLLLAGILTLWVLGLITPEMATELATKAGAIVGILFLVTLVLTLVTKPQPKTDLQDRK